MGGNPVGSLQFLVQFNIFLNGISKEIGYVSMLLTGAADTILGNLSEFSKEFTS